MEKTTLFERTFTSIMEKLNPKKHDAGDYVKDLQKRKREKWL
jgi:hypothetical protein